MDLYTPERIMESKKIAKHLSLKMPEDFLRTEAETLCRICNGIGPEKWKRKYRLFATFILRNFQEAAMIHDFRYFQSDGKRESRKRYDEEFYRNCLILLHNKYPYWKLWLFPVKIWAFLKIRIAKQLLQIFGASAYLSAYDNRKEKENASFQ